MRTLTAAEIGVVFQPIVDVSKGTLFAHEVLVRCKRPEYASPPHLFARAVEENACGRLGRLIRDVAFATSGAHPLFVNIHPDELSSRWLVRPDDPIGFHCRPVFLEITESATFTHFELCRDVLRELCRRTGAALVVDDFGAGHSNLERVVSLEPAVVKLDLALVRGVHGDTRKQIVIRHLVRLCGELGATVVAEGVETIEELACVRDLGVAFAQGYLLARPAAPPPEFTWPLAGASGAAGSRSLSRPASRRKLPAVPPPLPTKGRAPPAPSARRTSKSPPSGGGGARSVGRLSQKPTARPPR
ncbi:MAG TPA: EAL domain-containing protein [Polyangiaceae bacterium]|nr:EAL domain-containing protein [Polyangiaceae bacterium]